MTAHSEILIALGHKQCNATALHCSDVVLLTFCTSAHLHPHSLPHHHSPLHPHPSTPSLILFTHAPFLHTSHMLTDTSLLALLTPSLTPPTPSLTFITPSPQAHHRRGVALEKMNQWPEALAAYLLCLYLGGEDSAAVCKVNCPCVPMVTIPKEKKK